LPIHKAKYSGIHRDGKVRKSPKDTIEKREQLREKLPPFLAAPPYGNNNFSAGPPRFHQFRNNLRRILEIAVHDDRGVAAGSLETGRDSSHVAPVTGKLDYHYMRIRGLEVPQYLQRRISGTIIYINNFPVFICFFQSIGDSFMKLQNKYFFIVNGYDY